MFLLKLFFLRYFINSLLHAIWFCEWKIFYDYLHSGNKVNIFRNFKLFHKNFSLLLSRCVNNPKILNLSWKKKSFDANTQKKKVTKWRMKSFPSTQRVEFVGGKINFPQFYIVYLHNKEGKSVRGKKSFPVPAGVDSTTTEVRKSFRSFGCFWLFSFLSSLRDVKGNSDVETWCTYGAWKAWWIIWEIFLLISSARNKMCKLAAHECVWWYVICDESCWLWGNSLERKQMNEQNLIAAQQYQHHFGKAMETH